MLFAVSVCVGCARGGEPPAGKAPAFSRPAAPARMSQTGSKAANAPSARTAAIRSAAPEPALGVEDRGVFPDLDARVQLPAPPAGKVLSAIVDERHQLLVVYVDAWPYKVYPLGGEAELTVGKFSLAMRAGDRAELVGAELGLRRLGSSEAAPPGDFDGDGIPDPLDVLIGAHKTVLDGAEYDDGYFSLKYPNGDPPRSRGACVDVIVRAVRNAGVDLQAGVISDERAVPELYGVKHPDPSIDHRRVKNAITYFKRHWVPHSRELADVNDPIRPGDVVFLDTFPSRPGPDHVGIVSQESGSSGYPLVINLWTFGYKTQAMDLLESVPVTHRFRFPSRAPS